MDRNVDFLTVFAAGGLSGRYPTPYSTYQRLVAAEQDHLEDGPARLKLEVGGGDKSRNRTNFPQKDEPVEPRPRKLTWKETRELESVEAQVAELEAEKTRLEEAINQAGGDYEQLRLLAEQLESIEVDLESFLARWLELSDIE